MANQKQCSTRIVDKVRVKGKKNVVFLYEVYFLEAVDALDRTYIDTYEAAFRMYEKGEFAKALDEFTKCQQLKPSDKLSALFIERCQILSHRPLPVGWDGTYEMTQK